MPVLFLLDGHPALWLAALLPRHERQVQPPRGVSVLFDLL